MAKEIVRQLRAQDQARIRAAMEEDERELAKQQRQTQGTGN